MTPPPTPTPPTPAAAPAPADTIALEPFSRLVRRWHALAMDVPGPTFRRAAMQALADWLPMDSGWWGLASLRPGQLGVLQGDLFRLPASFTADWWSMADVDGLAAVVRDNPGLTVLDNGERPYSEAERVFDTRYDLRSAISTGALVAGGDLLSFVSLYRGRGRPRFDERDRAAVQALMPHLMQADRLQWELAAARRRAPEPEWLAQLDDAGFLAHAPDAFCAALVDEFPQWCGGALPAPLAAIAAAREGRWSGRRLEVRAFVDAAGRGGLALRPRIGAGLTPREELVARAYAAGDSYKHIAQALGLSPATVRGYLRSCYEKLGVSNKAALGQVIRGGG